MAALEIADKHKMRLIFDRFAELDKVRWSQPANYNLINWSHNDLTADEKLLTHWLCYITDRGTSFQRIWDVGGYVISDLVRSYTNEVSRGVKDLLGDYDDRWRDKDNKLHIRIKSQRGQWNSRLQRYGIPEGPVPFASRYMPQDLLLIFRTLAVLDKLSGRSFAGFLGAAAGNTPDCADGIVRMARALNALTYADGGAVPAERLDAALDAMAEQVTSDGEADLHGLVVRTEARTKRFDSVRFGRKRLWCALRDYLKSPEFNPIFVRALKDADVSDADRWSRNDPQLTRALDVLELPGDVWNNSPVIRDGLFRPYVSNMPTKPNTPQMVREIYKALGDDGALPFYPEQLDVTFDFVPRMCERQMCTVCLFGEGISNVCHRQSGLLCSVALVACGYRHECNPNTCTLKDDSAKGLCESRTGADARG